VGMAVLGENSGPKQLDLSPKQLDLSPSLQPSGFIATPQLLLTNDFGKTEATCLPQNYSW